MSYDDLLIDAEKTGLIIKEAPLQSGDGRCSRNRIAIRKDIPTQTQKACVLAEEIGHYYTASGNILDMSSVINRKQEHLGRMWAYNKLIGLIGIIDAFEHGCRCKFEIAEYLDVTEDFLLDAISSYRAKYGVYKTIDNYVIYFIPNLSVTKFLG